MEENEVDLDRLDEITGIVQESLGLDNPPNIYDPLSKISDCDIDPCIELVDIFDKMGYTIGFMRTYTGEGNLNKDGKETLINFSLRCDDIDVSNKFKSFAECDLNGIASQVCIKDLYYLDYLTHNQ